MICIYEDDSHGWLSPLTDLRPVFDLRCGRFTLIEKLRRLYPKEPVQLWVRDDLAEVTREVHPDCRVNEPTRKGRLFISGRVILDEPIPAKGREAVLLAGDEVVGLRVCAECATALTGTAGDAGRAPLFGSGLAQEQVKARVVRHPWDIVEMNAGELARECGRSQKSEGRSQKSEAGRLPKGAELVGPRRLLTVGKGVRVWPGAVISTETGPVMLDAGAVVRPGSYVEGPCYVGPGTVVDGGRIRPGCSFGPRCRVSGEVEASVFQGHANKSHDGYIGHSYVGEWVNLGALTTNSDLKNTYEPVQVFYPGGPVDTGLLKVGCFFGDHVKTAIGSLFNSGTRVGTGANWFETGLARKTVPEFSWGRHGGWAEEAFVENCRTVMARRGVTMPAAYERLLRARFAARGAAREG